MLTYGPNFRDKVRGSCLTAVDEALDAFIDRYTDMTTPSAAFAEWKEEVMKRCTDHLSRMKVTE